MECVVGGGESGYVGDIFTQGLTAFDVEIGEGRVGVVLCGEGCGHSFEVGEIPSGFHQLSTRPKDSKAAPSESTGRLTS